MVSFVASSLKGADMHDEPLSATVPPDKERDCVEALGFVSVFILLPFLSLTALGSSSILAVIAIVLIGGFLIYRGASLGAMKVSSVAIAFAALFAWMVILLPLDPSLSALLRIVQFASCAIVFAFAVFARKSAFAVRVLQVSVAAMLTLVFAAWILEGMPFSNYMCFWDNANVFSFVIFCWAAVLLVNFNKASILFLAISALLVFVSSARTTVLAFAVLVLLWLYLRGKVLGVRMKRRIRVLFIAVCVFIALFMIFYIATYNTSLGAYLDELSHQYLHKGFYSGRQRLWGGIFQTINESPFFGQGLSALPADFLDTGLSSHNLYLQVLLQSGYAGLFLLIALLWLIMERLMGQSMDNNVALSIAMIVAVVVQETFEVCLLQNHLMVGLMMWMIIGVGIKHRARAMQVRFAYDCEK